MRVENSNLLLNSLEVLQVGS